MANQRSIFMLTCPGNNKDMYIDHLSVAPNKQIKNS
jgi:hypothetical protein